MPSSRATADACATTVPVFRSVSARLICKGLRPCTPAPLLIRTKVPVNRYCAFARLAVWNGRISTDSNFATMRSVTRRSSSCVAAVCCPLMASIIGSSATPRLPILLCALSTTEPTTAPTFARKPGTFCVCATRPSVAFETASSKGSSSLSFTACCAQPASSAAPTRAKPDSSPRMAGWRFIGNPS